MAPIFETVLSQIIKSIESEDGIKAQTKEKPVDDFSLESDSEEGDEVVGIDIDTNFIDEKSSAIHALGNIALNCPGLMLPHLDRVVNVLMEVGFYLHENIRYHVCLSLTQISFGLLKFFTGRAENDQEHVWEAGLPLKMPFPEQVTEFLSKVVYPHFQKLFSDEEDKEVVEKVLECIRDIADDMGPGGIASNVPMIMAALEGLLDKETRCQTGDKRGNDLEEDDEEDEESDSEDYDHDEIILGNTTDVIISVAKCLGNDFAPLLAKLGPTLVTYLGPEHPKSDKIMVIGCLSEVLNSCPVAIQYYFDDYFKVILKHATTTDG